MKLEPTPKPVRIRIRSGESEHGSVDSLRLHFVFDDIQPLILDGRFSRWLRQQSLLEETERLDNALRNNDGDSIKYVVSSIVFGDTNIKDELSLLCSLSSRTALVYVLRRELKGLTTKQLDGFNKLDDKANSFKGELNYELGLRTDSLEQKCKFFKLASEAGVEEAKGLYDNALNQKKELKASRKDASDRPKATKKILDNDLLETIESLVSEYKAGSFKPGSSQKYHGPYFKYYQFFDFVIKLRQSNDLLFYFNNDTRGRTIYWEPDKELVKAQQLLEYAVYKYASNTYMLKSIPEIKLPVPVFDAFCNIYHNSKHYFIKALDCLCLNFAEYLRIQYAEQ